MATNTLDPINEAIVDAKAASEARAKAAAEARARAAFAASPAGKALKLQLEQQLVKVKTPADRDRILSQAKDAGVTVNQGYVDQANRGIVSDLRNQLVKAINNNSVTQAEVDAYKQTAETAKVSVDSSLINRATTSINSTSNTKQTALNNSFRTQLINAVNDNTLSQSKLDQIQADAKAAGAIIDAGALKSAEAGVQRYNATAPQRAALTEQYKTAIANAGTTDEINRQIAMARADGVTVDSGVIDQARANITATELGQTFNTQLSGVKTQADLDKIIADAKSAGAKLNSGLLDQTQQNITAQTKSAEATAQVAKTAEAQANWQKQIETAASTGNVEQTQSLIDQAKAAGQWNLNDAVTNSYIRNAQSVTDRAQAEKTALAQTQWQDKIQTAAESGKTDEVKSLIDQAKAAGQWNINDAVTNGYIRNAQTQQAQQQQAQSDFAAAQKTISGLQNLTYNSKINLTDLDQSLQKDPDLLRLTDNGKIAIQMTDPKAPGYLGVNQVANYFKSGDAYAQQREKIYEYASKLAPPTEAGNKFAPGGAELVGVPDDPTTQANEAAWYALIGGQMQQVGKDGAPTGGPIAPTELQAIQDQIRANTQSYEQQQKADQAALAASTLATTVKDFESALPSPADFVASGRSLLRGPDGSDYRLTPANLATGAPREWVKTDPNMTTATKVASGQTQTVESYNKEFNTIEDANNQVYQQQRAAQIAAAQEERDRTFFDTDFGKLFVIATIAAVAAPYVSELFSSAAAGESAAAASAMAEAGATAGEITSALQTAGLTTEAAATMAETATGIVAGTVDAATVAASSGVTADMLALANATADPIAALNAAAGWTSVDIGYLASIGAPASLLAQAEATNVAMGLDPSGLRVLTDAETAALEKNIDPDMINRFQPAEPVPTETAGLTEPPPYRVEVSGAAGTAEAPGYAIGEAMTPGTQLATNAQIDAGLATWNPAANAWEVGATFQSGAVAPVAEAVASSAINPVTGLLETITPGVGTNPVASLVLSAPEAAAAAAAAAPAVSSISPGVLAALGGGAAVLSGLAGGGSAAAGSGAVAAPAAPTPAPTPSAPVEVGGPIAQPPVVAEPLPPLESVPTAPTAPPTAPPAGPGPGDIIAQPVTPAPSIPTTTVPTTPPPAAGGTTVFNPGTGLYETTIPAGPGGVAEVVLSPTPPVGVAPVVPPVAPGIGAGEVLAGGAAAGAAAATGGAAAPVAATPVAPTAPAPAPTPTAPAPAPTAPPVDNLPPVSDAVATPNPNYTNPPVPSVPEAVVDLGKAAVEGMSAADLAKIAAGWVIVNGVLTPPEPTMPSYGPIRPLDWGSAIPLGTSGLNPGYITNVPAQYNTQNMQQSRFSWGQKPFQPGTAFDPALYRSAPSAPAQPWGLQQMYNPQTQTIGSLLEGVQQASTRAPYSVPAAPRV